MANDKDNDKSSASDSSEERPETETEVEQNGTKAPEQPKPEQLVTISSKELEQLKKEVAEFKDKYLRGLAEAENARKRLLKEKQEMILFSTQNLIAEFLHPLDHLENALKFTNGMSEEIKHWGLGFQMILAQFKDVLANNGVIAIDSKGKVFDPNLHEAVEIEETEKFPPGTVIEEFIRGYKMGDRVIRPARVKVAKAPSVSKKEEHKTENN